MSGDYSAYSSEMEVLIQDGLEYRVTANEINVMYLESQQDQEVKEYNIRVIKLHYPADFKWINCAILSNSATKGVKLLQQCPIE